MRWYTILQRCFLDLKSEIGFKQYRETGLIAVLACLIMAILQRPEVWIWIALSVTLITLLWPGFFYPLALVWFSLSKILSTLTSTVLLTVLYVGLLLPVGLIRKMLRKDSLRLRAFKKDGQSVFVHRGHQFEVSDLKHPF